jgi:hypothetical protein
MKFNAIKDLNKDELYERAAAEAKLIHKKTSTARGRSLEEIIETVLYGHAAELYLIKHHGFSDDPHEYKDVIDLDNNPVEVKVTEGEWYVPYVLERCNNAAKETWRKYPEILYVFIGNKETYDYHLHGIYHWDGEKFCLQTQEDDV